MEPATLGITSEHEPATLGVLDPTSTPEKSYDDETLDRFRTLISIANEGYSPDVENAVTDLNSGGGNTAMQMQSDVDNDDINRYNSKLDQLKQNPDLFKDANFRDDLMQAHTMAGLSTSQWKDLENGVGDWYKRKVASARPAEGLTPTEKKVLAKQQATAHNTLVLNQKYIEMKYPGSILGSIGNIAEDVATSLFPIGIKNKAIYDGVASIVGIKRSSTAGDVVFGTALNEAARDYVRGGANAKEQADRLDKLVNAVTRNNKYYPYNPTLDPEQDAAFRNQVANTFGLPVDTTFDFDNDSFERGANILVAAGSAISTLNVGRKVFGKFFGKLDTGSPVNSKLLNKSITDPAPTLTADQIASEVPNTVAKPRRFQDINDTGDEVFNQVIARAKENVTRLGKIKPAPIYDEKIQTVVQAETLSKLKEVSGATVRTDLTTLDSSDLAGFDYTMTFGKTDKVGFDDIREAAQLIENGHVPANSTIVRRDYGSQEFHPVTNEYYEATMHSGAAEYFVQSTARRNYSPEDMKFWGTDPLLNNTWNPVPQAKFTKRLYNVMSAAFNSKGRVANAFNKIVAGNYMKLSSEDRYKVSQLLHQGDLEGKTFTVSEIKAIIPGVTDELIAGYIEARAFMDAQFYMANRMVREGAERKGLATYTHSSGLKFIGKEASLQDINPHAIVYDLATSKGLKMDDINALVNAGKGAVYRANEAFQVASGQKHTLVYVPNGSGLYKSPLPKLMLNYNEGQITRLYDENYFVREHKVTQVDGIDHEYTQAVAAYRTEKEALEDIARRQAGNPKGMFSHDRDEKLRRALLEGVDEDTDLGGALFLSKRGPRLEGNDTDGKARIMDPIAAMNIARDVSANRVSMQEAYTAIERLLESKYGRDTLGDAAIISRNEKGVLTAPTGVKGDRLYDEAKAVYDWLQSMKYSDNVESAAWKQKYLNVAEWLEGKGLDRTAKFIANRDSPAPVTAVKQATSWALVLSAGPRQFLQNALQAATIAIIHPIAGTKALFMDAPLLSMGLLFKNSDKAYEAYKKIVGKATDALSATEFKALVKAYEDSGLPFTVNSHTFLKGEDFKPEIKMGQSTAVAHGLATAKDVAGTALSLPTTGLFKAGNHLNYAATFMMAYRILKAENKNFDITTEAGALKVGQRARMLMVDMGKINKVPALEDGMMSVIMQFAAFPLKSLAQFTNANLTVGQRGRIALGALALYGATNPFGDEVESIMLDMGIDQSDTYSRNLVQGGLMDLFLNHLVGGESNYAEFLNPYYGALKFVSDIFSGGTYGDDGKITLNPAAFGNAGNIAKVYTELTTLFKMPDDGRDTLPEVLNVIGSGIISQWGRVEKAKLGSKVGALVDASFDPAIKATYQDLLAKGVFGARSYREMEALEFQTELQDAETDRTKTVDAVAKQFIRIMSEYEQGSDAAAVRLRNIQLALPRLLDTPDGVGIVNDAMAKAMKYDDAKGGLVDDKAEKAFTKMYKALMGGKLPASYFDEFYTSDVFLKADPAKQWAFRKMEQDILTNKGVE